MNASDRQEQLSDAVKRQLAAIFTLASQWQARAQSVAPPEPDAGSSLSGDDDSVDVDGELAQLDADGYRPLRGTEVQYG